MHLLSSSYLLRPLALLAFGLFLLGPANAQNSVARMSSSSRFPLTEGIAMVGSVAYNPTTKTIASTAGTGLALLSAVPGGPNLLSILPNHEVADIEFDIMVGPDTKGALYFQGKYMFDLSAGKSFASLGSAGAPTMVAPLQQVGKAAGLWQHLGIRFAPATPAPKFASARITQATLGSARIVRGSQFPVGGSPMVGAPNGLYFLCTGGQMALRNINYRASDPASYPSMSALTYKTYEGVFDDFPAANKAHIQEGTIAGKIDYRVNALSTDFAFVVRGNIIMPNAGSYTLEIVAGGGAKMVVNGDTIIKRKFNQNLGANASQAKTVLKAGANPFSLVYFKHSDMSRGLGLKVTDLGLSQYPLTAEGTLPIASAWVPFYVEAKGYQPMVQRCFMHDFSLGADRKVPYAIAIGGAQQPQAATTYNYSYNLQKGSPFLAWKGAFLDVTGMWRGRGSDQMAHPMGAEVELANEAGFALLGTESDPWPDTLLPNTFNFKGYALQKGYPVYSYTGNGLKVTDAITPTANGLERNVRATGSGTGAAIGKAFYVLAAQGNSIDLLPSGEYSVDGQYRLHIIKGTKTAIIAHNDRKLLVLQLDMAKGSVGYGISF